MSDFPSQEKIVAYIAYFIGACIALWFAIRFGVEKHWQNVASAYEKQLTVALMETAQLKAKNAEVEVAFARCRESNDERATSFYRLQAKMEEYERGEEKHKRHIAYLENLLNKKPSSDDH